MITGAGATTCGGCSPPLAAAQTQRSSAVNQHAKQLRRPHRHSATPIPRPHPKMRRSVSPPVRTSSQAVRANDPPRLPSEPHRASTRLADRGRARASTLHRAPVEVSSPGWSRPADTSICKRRDATIRPRELLLAEIANVSAWR